MSVNMMLLPVTPELIAEKGGIEWLETLNLPVPLVPGRLPTYREINFCLSEMNCGIKFDQDDNIYLEVLSEDSSAYEYEIDEQSGERFYSYSELFLEACLHIIPDTDKDMPVKNMAIVIYQEFLKDFFQHIANRCGTYLVLGNGEPDYFVTPENV